MPYVTTRDGVRLHHLDEGQGPAVVLVSGYGGRASGWHFQRRALRDAGFRVLTVDRRHTGDSDFPPYGQRMARQAADLQELQQVLGLEGAVWVGSSMGSSALMAKADLFGCEAVRGLVLVDQTPRMVNDDDWDLGFYGLTWETLDGFVSRFPDGVSAFHAPPPPEVMAVIASDPGPPYPFDRTRALLRDHAVQDWRDVVGRLPVPVLAVGGRHSPVWPVASTEWIGRTAPHGSTVVLEDSGHAPHLSEPAAFNAALLDWISRLGR